LLSAQQTSVFKEIIEKPVDWGRIVESAVGTHLVNQAVREQYSVYYWRDRNDEVDFILERQGKIIAIEVKSSFSNNKKGMDAFKNKFNPHKIYFIDNKALSWSDFLKINPIKLF